MQSCARCCHYVQHVPWCSLFIGGKLQILRHYVQHVPWCSLSIGGKLQIIRQCSGEILASMLSTDFSYYSLYALTIVIRFQRPLKQLLTIYFCLIIAFFCFYQLPLELTKRNSTKLCHGVVTEPDFKMHVQNLQYPLPLKTQSQSPKLVGAA